MNVLILADAASMIGGADKLAIVSAVGLAQAGCKVTLFAAIGPADPMLAGVPNLKVVCLMQPEVSEAPSRAKAFLTQSWNRPAIEALKGVLAKFPNSESVIHVHCYLKMLSAGVVKTALDSGIPLVMTMHDYGIACPNRIFFHQPQRAICHRRPMGMACLTTNCMNQNPSMKAGRIVRFFIQDHFARISPRLKRAIFCSEFSRKILDSYMSKAAEQIVLQNPTDPQYETRVNVTENAIFTYVGRLVSEKDPVTLAIAARLAEVPVAFVGEGPEKESVLRENPKAEITGWVRPQEVHRRLRISRAFVIPSIWYECSPLVTVEAQSHGLPVICSDTNASRDSVEHGVTGFHFASGKPEDLAEKLQSMTMHEIAGPMSVATYDRFWADPPSTERHIAGLLQIYSQMMNR